MIAIVHPAYDALKDRVTFRVSLENENTCTSL